MHQPNTTTIHIRVIEQSVSLPIRTQHGSYLPPRPHCKFHGMHTCSSVDVEKYVPVLEHWRLLLCHLDSHSELYYCDKLNIVV